MLNFQPKSFNLKTTVMEKPSKKQVVLVFGFFMLLALGWFVFNVYGDVKAAQTLFWPSTEGTVISGEVATVHSSKGSSKSKPVIRYSFAVNGVEYESDRYSSTMVRGSSFWAKEVVDKYSAGSTIKVYYNPENPVKSVIDRGFQKDDLWMTLLSLAIFMFLFYALRRQLKAMKINNQTEN
jgi:hypothetical protein